MQIDENLIQKAVELGGHKTKKAAINQALIDYVEQLEQKRIVTLFGHVEYEPEYDYKEQRRRQ